MDPLRCPRCESEMVVIAWITDRAVIDRILEHRTKAGLESPFDARGPHPPGSSDPQGGENGVRV